MIDHERDLANKWAKTSSSVCDAMKLHTRPFIAPLSRETAENVWLEGTGTYISIHDRRLLLTCEHVSSVVPIDYRFYGSENVYRVKRNFVASKSIDVAFTPLSEPAWDATDHQAKTISVARFADEHRIVDRGELLFIHGFSGENSVYAFETLMTNASAYVSQQKEDVVPDEKIFEVFWEPQETTFTKAATDAERKSVRFENSAGLNGSVVWNTRYCETIRNGTVWTPEDAVVTGLLRRWDTGTKTLLVLRVEHLRKWLLEQVEA